MARLSWATAGDRVYEAGVDRGVLYVGATPGVAWTGLISVTEKPSGGQARGHYQDGVKFLNVPPREEFEATINAYASPPQFAACDGSGAAGGGLFVLQQPRQEFGISYRTLIGNDLLQQNYGYKLHFIYNALADPSDKDHNSLGGQLQPDTFSWNITATPEKFSSFRPTAHYVVDSRYADPARLAVLESVVYGSDGENPRLPSPSEIYLILTGSDVDDIIVIDNGDGTFTAIGSDVFVQDNGDGTFVINHWRAESITSDVFRLTVS